MHISGHCHDAIHSIKSSELIPHMEIIIKLMILIHLKLSVTPVVGLDLKC